MQEPCGSPRHSKIGIRVFKNLGEVFRLPVGQIFQYAAPDRRRLRQPTIEEDEIHRCATPQEIAKMPRYRRVLGVGKSHFP